ncbi:class I SAM-dependent DNA methyltransferase [Mesorhizobium sp. M8A.F.Ca.ET.208.01.1.1]|uniref:class I SAM-dependent DNA methyltransferase n=1 Tax=unclassified Mesorhizobium TaxID=325217 RepID=UPI001093CD58|nr:MULTISPECIES: DNA methyltransferase [unclassified Mesorhizobium]TGQ88817.1 class I SAM-dependent DNA methyltransferase [Mesorhizobium sp. M8A.F.Ca.ET.208.01.1.1]TGT50104.1 class I SAM-dependent DNA methyltransferase [Mesorhizobium sp. M8A.F.Ca.ET.167.01.1.1]
MTPQAFIAKWQNSQLKERAAAQEHFLDLCRMLGEPTPADVDPTGKDYGFEVGASKSTGGNGFADVFKRGHFGWEYKGTAANLETAYAQLQRYAVALDNPPLLIVSDIGTTIRIHTNWTNSVSKTYDIPIADLNDPEKRGWLKSALSDPEVLRPQKTRQELTEEVAGAFADLARSLRNRGHAPDRVAHFINRLVFCMFAEDVKLLPNMMFTHMLERAMEDPNEFASFARDLFVAMKSGGRIGFEKVAWFNGGLFDDDLVFELTKDEIKLVHRAATQYWGDVDPSILGTLFERGLDPDKRSQLGAHYTDREKIMMIINPVIVEPLTGEWERTKNEIASLMAKAANSNGSASTRARNQAQGLLETHLKRLKDFRVLDPACGSGNFLYLALRALKDLEHKTQVEAEALGLPRGFPQIGPEVVKGIEINAYAAELARVSVWIGEIQWMLRNGFAASQNPVLKPLDNIECRDALMTRRSDPANGEERWVEADWPRVDVIVGNPPFLGSKFFRKGRPQKKGAPRSGLGDGYTDTLYRVFKGKVRGSADLVTYWFYKAGQAAAKGDAQAFGLIATKSITKGASNQVLRAALKTSHFRIFSGATNEPWVVDGAQVRVSVVCASRSPTGFVLNGCEVSAINPDLTDGTALADAHKLRELAGLAFQGVKLNGPFALDGATARNMLLEPQNANGRYNLEVVRPFLQNDDVTARPEDEWVIDFTEHSAEADASLYQVPFEWVTARVKEHRAKQDISAATETARLARYWVMQRPRPELRAKLHGMERCIIVPETSEHLLFVFRGTRAVFSGSLFVIARDDDTTFGILSSRAHWLWSRAQGNRMGKGNQSRYNATRTFQTFPFPQGLTPNICSDDYKHDARSVAIADAAFRLNQLRENWLNPADLVRREPEVVPGFPDRLLPISEEAAGKLRTRTLTSLYNDRPSWLQNAHKALDDAVATAYGWPTHLSDDEVLTRLFLLNQERANHA